MGLRDICAVEDEWTFQGVDMTLLNSLAGDSLPCEEKEI